MYYSQTKCETDIAESPLFTLEKGTSDYERETYNMAGYLFGYLMSRNEHAYEACGCEILETAMRCIRSYIPEKGPFLSYFNAAWNQEYRRLQARQRMQEQFGGMQVSREDLRCIRHFLRLRYAGGVSTDGSDLYEKIAEAMKLTTEQVRLIAEMSEFSVISDQETGGNGGVYGLIPDTFSLERYLESQESTRRLLSHIDAVFNGLQLRQRPMMSELLTARILPELEDLRTTEGCRFVSQEIWELYFRTGQVPAQQAIARKYGRSAASASRTMNQFLDKLKIQLERGTEHGF